MIRDFRELIIIPTLRCIGKWSQSAENILFMTVLCESNEGQYLKQIGGGPGLGPYSIEPATYRSIIKWLNSYDNKVLKESCLSACFYTIFPSEEALIHNLRWSTLCARALYLSIDKLLPIATDIDGLAIYYKTYYNRNGAATVERAIELYQKY